MWVALWWRVERASPTCVPEEPVPRRLLDLCINITRWAADRVRAHAMLQLVKEAGQADIREDAFTVYLASAAHLFEHGNPPRVVSIIGPQSSGKSTLLNALFGTDFHVLAANAPPGRTTEGLWCTAASSTLIIDSQGSDSIEGGDAGKVFERRAATFMVALSGAVIININFKDLGRHEGSQIWLLRQIFSVHAELLGGDRGLSDGFETVDLVDPEDVQHVKQKRTLLLFVIRDYPSGDNAPPLEPIGHSLQRHIIDAWGAAHPHDELTNHFRLHVCHLPNPNAEPTNFCMAVKALRKRHFESKATDSTFERETVDAWAQPITTPRELATYSAQLWAQICASRQLDAPTFRESLARKWCGIARRDIQEVHALEVERLWSVGWPSRSATVQTVCTDHSGVFADLADELAASMLKALGRFDAETRLYIANVVSEHRAILLASLQQAVEHKLNKLLCAALDERFANGLQLRPNPMVGALQKILPPVIGTIEQPGLALALCPLSLTVGEEEQVMVAEVEHVLRLLDAFCRSSEATIIGHHIMGATPDKPLSSAEWTVLSNARAREPLLTAAHREDFKLLLEGRCRDKVKAALQRQQRIHEGHVSGLKERAAGLAVLGGGLAWVGGFSLMGPAVAVVGGIAGGSSRAAGMLCEAAVWVSKQRLPTQLDTPL